MPNFIKRWFPNDGGASLVDQVLVSGGNFLTIAICAHKLPLSEQGVFTYVFASYMALLLINVSGIFQGAAVRAPSLDASYQESLAFLQFVQSLLLSFLVGATWLLGGGVVGWQANMNEVMLLFVFLVTQQLADFDRRGSYVFSDSRRAMYSSALLYPLRIIGLLVIQPSSVEQVLLVMICAALIPSYPVVRKALCCISGDIRSRLVVILNHIVYSRFFIAGSALGWLWSYLPIFMLGTMHGKEQAALLASIRGVSNIANVLMEQIETKVAADWARARHADGDGAMESAAIRFLKIGTVAWLLSLLVVIAFGKEIVLLTLGSLYAPHWHLLLIFWCAFGIYFIARVYGIKHRALGATRVEFFGNFCGVLIALAAGVVLIPSLEATGAALVYVAIMMTMLVSQIYVVRNR